VAELEWVINGKRHNSTACPNGGCPDIPRCPYLPDAWKEIDAPPHPETGEHDESL